MFFDAEQGLHNEFQGLFYKEYFLGKVAHIHTCALFEIMWSNSMAHVQVFRYDMIFFT